MKYFPFNKLWDYYHMLEATVIFLMVVGIVWTLASLYYHSTKELRLRHSVAPKDPEKRD